MLKFLEVIYFAKSNALSDLWLCTGPALKRLEEEKGVLVRFVIGRRSYFVLK